MRVSLRASLFVATVPETRRTQEAWEQIDKEMEEGEESSNSSSRREGSY